MNDADLRGHPAAVAGIAADTAACGFTMASEPKVGAMLAVLAASKPGGRFLELGTGTGHGAAWLLSGMDAASTLDTVDTDPEIVAIARRHLGSDPRVTFHVIDGGEFLQRLARLRFRSDLCGCLAGEVQSPGRGARIAPAGRDLCHRRSVAPAELAGGSRTTGAGADRGSRAASGVRHGEAGLGIGADGGGVGR